MEGYVNHGRVSRRRRDGPAFAQAGSGAAAAGRGDGGLWHPRDRFAAVLGVDPKTLRKHYRDELDLGEIKANAQVAGFLFNSARSGNVTALIFWLKTRARWRETPTELKHSGSIGRKELCEYTDEELMAIIREGAAELGFVPMKTISAEDGNQPGSPVPTSATPRLVYPAR